MRNEYRREDSCEECGLVAPNHSARCGSSGMADDAVFGYAVYANVRENGSHSIKVFRSKGKNETKAKRVAIFKRGFESLERIEPLTRREWLNMFGEGRM